MFGHDELVRMRRKLQRRVIVSGVATAIVLGAAFYLGRRQPPTRGDVPLRGNEMAQHHVGR